jgi:hypothetical protein
MIVGAHLVQNWGHPWKALALAVLALVTVLSWGLKLFSFVARLKGPQSQHDFDPLGQSYHSPNNAMREEAILNSIMREGARMSRRNYGGWE